ncbi:hypothetical protein E2C01_043709 [Portunus trituberculatus]|uniref:Uncharacterized protein n=1 Tax=Portunus trituberculatus TaxID=210409 RepID=A0A5B7FTN2_PORTR|nr:hypothetical protein [Portunus trituberculatus]
MWRGGAGRGRLGPKGGAEQGGARRVLGRSGTERAGLGAGRASARNSHYLFTSLGQRAGRGGYEGVGATGMPGVEVWGAGMGCLFPIWDNGRGLGAALWFTAAAVRTWRTRVSRLIARSTFTLRPIDAARPRLSAVTRRDLSECRGSDRPITLLRPRGSQCPTYYFTPPLYTAARAPASQSWSGLTEVAVTVVPAAGVVVADTPPLATSLQCCAECYAELVELQWRGSSVSGEIVKLMVVVMFVIMI